MMATKPATTAEAPAPDTDAETTLDTQSGAVKRLIAKGKGTRLYHLRRTQCGASA